MARVIKLPEKANHVTDFVLSDGSYMKVYWQGAHSFHKLQISFFDKDGNLNPRSVSVSQDGESVTSEPLTVDEIIIGEAKKER